MTDGVAKDHENFLLAEVMRKIITQRHGYDGCYIDICRDSICIDGWVNDLTPAEVEAVTAVYEESKE